MADCRRKSSVRPENKESRPENNRRENKRNCGILRTYRGSEINNANILTMGGWITGEVVGCQIADTFLNTEFTQNLEEWRANNLRNAEKKVKEIEEQIYG